MTFKTSSSPLLAKYQSPPFHHRLSPCPHVVQPFAKLQITVLRERLTNRPNLQCQISLMTTGKIGHLNISHCFVNISDLAHFRQSSRNDVKSK